MVGAIFRKLTLTKKPDNPPSASTSSLPTTAAAKETGRAYFDDLPEGLIESKIIPLLPSSDLEIFQQACKRFYEAVTPKTVSYPNPKNTQDSSLTNKTFSSSLKRILKLKPSITELDFNFRQQDFADQVLELFLDETLPLTHIESLTVNSSNNLNQDKLAILLQAIQIKCPNFKHLNLYGCSKITLIPESIQGLTQLETLDLSFCKINSLPDSFEKIKLKKLNLSNCNNLKNITDKICKIITLEELDLTYCKNIQSLPELIGNLVNLEKINLHGCGKLKELPNSICKLTKLRELNLRSCDNLGTFPNISELQALKVLDLTMISGSNWLENWPNFSKLTQLRVLKLGNQSDLNAIQGLKNCQNLEHLNLSGCNNFDFNFFKKNAFPKLKTLKLNDYYLKSIHLGINEIKTPFPGLKKLEFSSGYYEDPKTETHVPSWIFNSTQLEELSLTRCNDIKYIPEEISNLKSLKILRLNWLQNIDELPPSISELNNLEKLIIIRTRFKKIPDLSNMSKLQELVINDSLLQSTEFTYQYDAAYRPKHKSFAKLLPPQCFVTFEHNRFSPQDIQQRAWYD